MPELARFFGMIVTMFYDDHPPPHFHVRYGSHKAIIAIQTLGVIDGHLPPRALGMIMEWGARHRAELTEAWALAARHAPLKPIAPLE